MPYRTSHKRLDCPGSPRLYTSYPSGSIDAVRDRQLFLREWMHQHDHQDQWGSICTSLRELLGGCQLKLHIRLEFLKSELDSRSCSSTPAKTSRASAPPLSPIG